MLGIGLCIVRNSRFIICCRLMAEVIVICLCRIERGFYRFKSRVTDRSSRKTVDLICAVCARSYSKCLGKTHKEDTWFGALDVFSYVSEAHRFSSEFPLIRKWSEDWKEARLNDNPDVDIDKSIKCQLGRIFCDALQTDPNAVYKWRRVEGKYFEYCRIK